MPRPKFLTRLFLIWDSPEARAAIPDQRGLLGLQVLPVRRAASGRWVLQGRQVRPELVTPGLLVRQAALVPKDLPDLRVVV